MATDYFSKINITPEFLREYEGKYIYDTGTGKRYKVANGQVSEFDIEASNAEWLRANNLRWGQYGSGAHNQEVAANEFQISDSGLDWDRKLGDTSKLGYRYIKQDTPEYQQALTNNFGLGPIRTPEEIANNAAVLAQVRGEQAGTLTAPNATNVAANPTVQAAAVDYGRKLGPTEFTGLAREWGGLGLTPAEIEKYYLNRDENNNIYLKSGNLPSANEIIGLRPGTKTGTIDMGGGAMADATVVPKSNLDNIQYDTANDSGLYERAGVTSPFDQYIADVQAEMTKAQENAGVQDKLTKLTTLQTEAAQMKTALENESIFNLQEIEQASGALAPMSTIRLRQSNISRDQQFEMMIAQNEYNGKLQEIAIAQGAYAQAEEIAKESAALFKEVAMMELERTLDLTDEQKAKAEEALEYQRSLAEAGYVYIGDPAELAKLTADQIFKDPVTGRIYKRPVTTTKSSGGGGGNNSSSSTNGLKLSTTQRNQLITLGLSPEDINNFVNYANTNGYEEALKYLDGSVRTNVTKIIQATETTKLVTEDQRKATEFLTNDYFKNNISTSKLKSLAKAAGYTAGGFLGFGVGEEGINDYLKAIMEKVAEYRSKGKTDEEIWSTLKANMGL